MADRSEELNDYMFCSVCRLNHDKGRKHIFGKKHNENLQNILTKFLKKVNEARKFLHKPSVEDGELEPGAKFWCHFCAENVEKHVTDRSVSIRHGGVFEHFASKNHHKNVHSFWWLHGAEKQLKKKFLIEKEDFTRYKMKVDEALQAFETQLEQKRQKDVQKIKQIENRQAETSQQPPTVQVKPQVVYRTVQNEFGILQNPTGWDNGVRVWGGGIIKYRHQSDQWFPWIMDAEDSLPTKSSESGVTTSTRIQTAAAHSETLTCITIQELRDGEGNVHSGATPPWMKDDEDKSETNGEKATIGPSYEEFKKHTERLKKACKNPNRIGANFDHNEATSDDWLPCFGRVWNHGPRWKSRHEFKGELKGRKDTGQESTQ